jgi:hypothetical protein
MVARGENERHIAAGVSQGSFCGLRSGGAGAKMPFEIPILRQRVLVQAGLGAVKSGPSPATEVLTPRLLRGLRLALS